MREGLARHGVEVRQARNDDDVDCDFCVVWGFRRIPLFHYAQKAGTPVLILERGHLQPRMEETSMGWNGLAGLGVRPQAQDDGCRFRSRYGHMMEPWRDPGGYVLVMGQMQGDASLHGLNFAKWAQETCDRYLEAGHEVVYRPHPLARQSEAPAGVIVHAGMPLEESLKGADICVTYTSTSSVEAVLSGVRTVSCHEGSIARDVTAHGVMAEPMAPDRTRWANRLAWGQFTPEEIINGLAWDVMETCIPTR